MGKIKRKPDDDIRIEVHPVKAHESPPHIVSFVNPFGTDHKGELCAMADLHNCETRQEVLLELGRVLLESSKNVQVWLRKQGIE